MKKPGISLAAIRTEIPYLRKRARQLLADERDFNNALYAFGVDLEKFGYEVPEDPTEFTLLVPTYAIQREHRLQKIKKELDRLCKLREQLRKGGVR